MINPNLLWLMLIPLGLALITQFYILPKTGRVIAHTHQYWQVSLGLFAVGVVIMVVAFNFGKGTLTADTEVWNGEIINKSRVHGQYQESYECNCRTVTSGSGKNQTTTRTCDTCYRDHYTVKWAAQSTIGEFRIASLDETSSSVYSAPDPTIYTLTKAGDSCAKLHDYTNYIKAVPESLFRPSSETIRNQYKGMIPNYPNQVRDLWRIDRVVPVGINVPNIERWNMALADTLKTLGPAKQVNIVIVLTKATDSNYEYALRDAWINGKKNDVILIVGAPNFPNKASWVRVLALTDREDFKIHLRDDVLALNELTPATVIPVLQKNVYQLYKRKPMKDFAYLDAEIDPPTWIIGIAISIILALFIWLWYVGLDRNGVIRQWRGQQPKQYNRSRRF